ncbi:MAG: hypothetical protein NXI31_00025 [bacterium]|nr:hypothetical protein [bacterium]
MKLSIPSLLALSLVTGVAAAQGDECAGALPVTVGAYGPFSTGNASTSFPWPCASGGNDVWFVAVANANGTATFDTCGSNFDTCIEVLDGTGGCTNLTSLLCNDDSCGRQSSVTVNVTNGQLLYVRAGGWNGSQGILQFNVAGDIGPATGFAAATNYGSGCYDNRASFYELISDPANFDLSNTSFTMLPNAGGYTIVPGLTGFVTPGPNAAILALGDDTSSLQSLTNPFPIGTGSTPVLVVYSNGFVATGTNNASIGTIVPANFFNEPDTAWRNWHDYDPGSGGQVTFEEVGPVVYCTWTNVPDWNVPNSSSTFQMQFDTSSGAITFVFLQMSLTGGGGGGNGHMIGYSPGGPSLQPAPTDISTAVPATFSVQADDSLELVLEASDRPILGTTFDLVTSNVPAASGLGVQVFGLGQINPGTDLGALGMAGCRQYLSTDTNGFMVPVGGSTTWPLTSPNSAGLAGVRINTQSLVLVAGVNPFGALTSNGVQLQFDIN